MGKIIDALEEARSNAQALHSKLTTVKDHAAIRANARAVAADTVALLRSVHTLTESQRTDAKHHLRDAASALEAASKDAREVADGPEARLKENNAAMRGRVRKAVQLLSLAVAAKRAHQRLVKA